MMPGYQPAHHVRRGITDSSDHRKARRAAVSIAVEGGPVVEDFGITNGKGTGRPREEAAVRL